MHPPWAWAERAERVSILGRCRWSWWRHQTEDGGWLRSCGCFEALLSLRACVCIYHPLYKGGGGGDDDDDAKSVEFHAFYVMDGGSNPALGPLLFVVSRLQNCRHLCHHISSVDGSIHMILIKLRMAQKSIVIVRLSLRDWYLSVPECAHDGSSISPRTPKPNAVNFFSHGRLLFYVVLKYYYFYLKWCNYSFSLYNVLNFQKLPLTK